MTITHEQALKIIKQIVKEKGLSGAARQLDISAAYLTDILKDERPISDRVAQALGYRRVIVYQKVDDEAKGEQR